MERESRLRSRAVVVQRVVATLALLIALGAVGSTFRSFGALGTVGCGAPVLGSKVEHRASTSSFLYGREAAVCTRNGHSRLAIAGVVAVLTLVLGVAGWARPLGLPWWLTGEDPPHLAGRRRDGADAERPEADAPGDPGSPPSVGSTASAPAKRGAARAAPGPPPAERGPANAAPGEVPDQADQGGRLVSLGDRDGPAPSPPATSDRRASRAPRRDGS